MIRKGSPYSMHPGFAMEESSMRLLKERTGADLAAWIKRLKKEGPAEEKAQREWLKEQGLTTNYCWWIAERAAGRGAADQYDPDADVDAMFKGKEAMRPIYDALLKMCLKIGKDVKACPCATIVPLYRNHVFAQIKPSTKTRIDFGLALKDKKATGRLIDTGGFAKKDRITHRIEIKSVDDIDEYVKGMLREAYDLDA